MRRLPLARNWLWLSLLPAWYGLAAIPLLLILSDNTTQSSLVRQYTIAQPFSYNKRQISKATVIKTNESDCEPIKSKPTQAKKKKDIWASTVHIPHGSEHKSHSNEYKSKINNIRYTSRVSPSTGFKHFSRNLHRSSIESSSNSLNLDQDVIQLIGSC